MKYIEVELLFNYEIFFTADWKIVAYNNYNVIGVPTCRVKWVSERHYKPGLHSSVYEHRKFRDVGEN